VAKSLLFPIVASAGEQKPKLITIETAPAAKMRYPTIGDWQFKPERLPTAPPHLRRAAGPYIWGMGCHCHRLNRAARGGGSSIICGASKAALDT
jgi:hypothetical protein